MNTDLSNAAFQSDADTFLVNQTLALLINIYSKNPHLRQTQSHLHTSLIPSSINHTIKN